VTKQVLPHWSKIQTLNFTSMSLCITVQYLPYTDGFSDSVCLQLSYAWTAHTHTCICRSSCKVDIKTVSSEWKLIWLNYMHKVATKLLKHWLRDETYNVCVLQLGCHLPKTVLDKPNVINTTYKIFTTVCDKLPATIITNFLESRNRLLSQDNAPVHWSLITQEHLT